MDSLLDNAWHLFLALLGIGFLIFIHELGHFVAAKLCGIRVETFALGFQPTFFGFRMRFFAFRIGETEYVLGMVPFGGYVKMTGEELTDEKTGAPNEFMSKPPGQRAIVLVAGAAMNILFGFLFFIAAFSIGVPSDKTVLNRVEPGSPAWDAGLRIGDHILEVDGVSMLEAIDTGTTLALAGDRDIPIVVERAGSGQHLHFLVHPVSDQLRGIPFTGVDIFSMIEGVTNRVKSVGEGSPAETAGLRPRDSVQSISLKGKALSWEIPRNLIPFQQWEQLLQFVDNVPGCVVEMAVTREDGSTQAISAQPRPREASFAMGINPAANRIARVRPGSPAASVFQEGQAIVSIGGTPIYSLGFIPLLSATSGQERASLQTGAGASHAFTPSELIQWITQSDLAFCDGRTRVDSVEPGSNAERAGLQPGDALLSVDGFPVNEFATRVIADLKSELTAPRKDRSLTWSRGESLQRGVLPASGQSSGLTLRVEPFVIGWVVPDSGAAQAGLLPGDAILALEEKEFPTWLEIRELVAAKVRQFSGSGPPPIIKTKVGRGGTVLDLEIPLLSVGFAIGMEWERDQLLLKASGWGAITLGSRLSVTWIKRVFLTLRSLAYGEVHVRNLQGPVGIIDNTKNVVRVGWGKTLFLLALISLNLGVFNLLPFPILDGGHLFFLAIEKLKGSPVSEKIQYYIHLAAFILLISLALFVTYHDLDRWRW